MIFRDAAVMDAWLCGRLRLGDLADRLASAINRPHVEVLDFLRQGCTHLALNPVTHALARRIRHSSLKSALVTVNGDVFTDLIVHDQQLDSLFDVIVNSADAGQCDKSRLWPLAFRALGREIGYHNSLLIEDNATQIALFRDLGGVAYQYDGDTALAAWLACPEAQRLLGALAGPGRTVTPLPAPAPCGGYAAP